MTDINKSELEKIRDRQDVKHALHKGRKVKKLRIVTKTKHKISLATYVILLVTLSSFQYALKLGVFDFLPQYLHLKPSIVDSILLVASKVTQGATTVILVLTMALLIRIIFINGVQEAATRFNLNRVLNLIVGIVLFFIILSILFANWYAAVYSLGLISLILGFALQTPITSFIAWILIIINRPFKVGDRIKIGEAAGDVIDIGYLTTTLWETYGDTFSNDHPSGRVIQFPNSTTLSAPVYNYSWPLFPYIWDEIKIFVGFKSDLELLATIMKSTTEEVLGHTIEEKAKIYQDILKDTPIQNNQLNEKPDVSFRVSENTWIEAKVHYLVDPKNAGNVKTKIIKKLMSNIEQHQETIMFPDGYTR